MEYKLTGILDKVNYRKVDAWRQGFESATSTKSKSFNTVVCPRSNSFVAFPD